MRCKRKIRSKFSSALVLLVGVFLTVATANAATKVWQGASGGNWTTGGNWVGDVAPANDTTTDRAEFDGTSSGSVNVDASRSVGGLVIQRDIAFAGQRLTYGDPGLVVSAGISVTCSNELLTGVASMGDGSTLTFLNIAYNGGHFYMTNATINFKSQIGFYNNGNFYGSGRLNYASTYTNGQSLRLAFNDNVGLVWKSEASDPVNNTDMFFRFAGTSTLTLEKDANLTVANSAGIGVINGPIQLMNSTTTTVSGAYALTISQLNVKDNTEATLELDGATLNIGDGGGIAEGVYSVGGSGGGSDSWNGFRWTLAATTNGGTLRVKSSTKGSNFNPNGGAKGGHIIVGTNATLISNCVWTNRDFSGWARDIPGLQVDVGGTLGGTGVFSMARTYVAYERPKYTVVSGHVAPGDGGIGTLTVNCPYLRWNSVSTNGSKWVWDLGANNAADKLSIDGDFTKGSGTQFFFDLQNVTPAGSFVLAEWTSNTTFTASDFAVLNGRGSFSISDKQLILTLPPRGTMIKVL